MVTGIQIVTNGKQLTDVSSYWKRKDTDEFLPDGVTPNPNYGKFTKDATLAQVIFDYTIEKFPANGTDPLKSEVVFGLEPFLDFVNYQVVIAEGDTNYNQIDGTQYWSQTEITFDIYWKNQELSENLPQLENLISEIQSIWMNYQNHYINGLSQVIVNNRFVDQLLARQSETSNYEKSFSMGCLYQIARTSPILDIALTYEDPKVAGAYATN